MEKTLNRKELSLLRDLNIHKCEDVIERDSEEIIRMSKRLFWNNVAVIGFMIYGLLYIWLTENPHKIIIWLSLVALLIASSERLYIHKKIKKAVCRLTTFSMIIDYLKKTKK